MGQGLPKLLISHTRKPHGQQAGASFAKFFVLTLLLIALGFGGLETWYSRKIPLEQPVTIELQRGASLRSFAESLESKGLVSNGWFFHGRTRLVGNYKKFQAGPYRFSGDVSPMDIAKKIMSGEVFRPVVIQYTIPEGFTGKQTAERLAALGIGHIRELRSLLNDESFAVSLNLSGNGLEGYIYPATYSYTETPNATEALTRMVKTFWQNLPKGYAEKVADRGLSIEQAVIFASLIELETMHDEERSMVSEVIWNRLKDQVPLAIDATLIYGIPDYKGDLTWKHLKDAKNPYNTRIHKGLPPTAIGSPSTKSLEAVLRPTDKGYYYYVLLPGTTRHHFSKTLKEHNRHVQRLVKGSKSNR
jgi:UPF0755 protein